MDTSEAARLLERARAVLAATADNAELHALNCPTCNGHFKCDGARYWADAAERAGEWVERRQQELRRATLAGTR